MMLHRPRFDVQVPGPPRRIGEAGVIGDLQGRSIAALRDAGHEHGP
jgi:hypothetical protein